MLRIQSASTIILYLGGSRASEMLAMQLYKVPVMSGLGFPSKYDTVVQGGK